MRVAIAGSSGLIGHELARGLAASGHGVLRLLRAPAPQLVAGESQALWEPARGILDPHALDGCDVVVNLTGSSIAGGRWNTARNEEMRSSRIQAARLLAGAIASLVPPPRLLFCASAIGYYGRRPPDEILDEFSPAGHSFFAQVVQDWEAAAAPAAAAGVRTVHARFGLVLSARGGALKRMLPLFRLGLGGRFGSGQQMMSWIALPEILPAMLHVLDHGELSGPVNFTAPGALSNAAFTRTLAGVLRRPAVAHVPAPLLRLALGEMADELLLSGQRVHPAKLLASGYSFRHPALAAALSAVLSQR
jgi:hypothetical protein